MWIQDIVDAKEEVEAPRRYYYWSAISAIAAITKKNIYLDRFEYKLYPNVYVLLIGESGLRKGNPISMAAKLVERVQCTRVISGRGSIQGIISHLGKALTMPDKSMLKEACGFLCSSELDAMLVKDEQAFSILTDFYDTHLKDGNWKNHIKSGPDELRDVCVTMLAGSNETNLSGAWPPTAVNGGLVARTLIVYEDELNTINSLVERPSKTLDFDKAVERLFQIANLRGSFTYSPQAKAIFNDWYHDHVKKLRKKPDKTGTGARIHDTILKVAMCLSLAEKNELILEEDNIAQAIKDCMGTIPGMMRVFMGSGGHEQSKIAENILRILISIGKEREYKLVRGKLLSRLFGIADAIQMDMALDTLVQSGKLESYVTPDGPIYKLQKWFSDIFEEKVKEERK